MKTRAGFVSNSSSSSFTVLFPRKINSVNDIKQTLKLENYICQYLWDDIKYWENPPEKVYDNIDCDNDVNCIIIDRINNYLHKINLNTDYLKDNTEEYEISVMVNDLIDKVTEYKNNKLKEELYEKLINKYPNASIDNCDLKTFGFSDEEDFGYMLITSDIFKEVVYIREDS